MTKPLHTATDSAGVLSMLVDPKLRDELDRVAAAVGVRIVHGDGRKPVTRKAWSAAGAVVLDPAAARGLTQAALPRRAHVCLLTGAEAGTDTWVTAVAIGAGAVLQMPEQEGELIRELAEAVEAARDEGLGGEVGQVISVIGGSGGAGVSLFAAALAQSAADALLVDLDPWGGGIDLLMGCENLPGLRWPGLSLQGGRLAWSAVRDGLPRHRGISLLSGTGAARSWIAVRLARSSTPVAAVQ